MPAAPTLSTTITSGGTGHIADTNTVHTLANAIYLASIGTARTTAFTLAQSDSGSVIPMTNTTSVAVTAPVLAAGSSIELARWDAAFTLTVSGTVLRVPAGATATPRVQYSTVSLLWRTATEILVGGDLT